MDQVVVMVLTTTGLTDMFQFFLGRQCHGDPPSVICTWHGGNLPAMLLLIANATKGKIGNFYTRLGSFLVSYLSLFVKSLILPSLAQASGESAPRPCQRFVHARPSCRGRGFCPAR